MRNFETLKNIIARTEVTRVLVEVELVAGGMTTNVFDGSPDEYTSDEQWRIYDEIPVLASQEIAFEPGNDAKTLLVSLVPWDYEKVLRKIEKDDQYE